MSVNAGFPVGLEKKLQINILSSVLNEITWQGCDSFYLYFCRVMTPQPPLWTGAYICWAPTLRRSAKFSRSCRKCSVTETSSSSSVFSCPEAFCLLGSVQVKGSLHRDNGCEQYVKNMWITSTPLWIHQNVFHEASFGLFASTAWEFSSSKKSYTNDGSDVALSYTDAKRCRVRCGCLC